MLNNLAARLARMIHSRKSKMGCTGEPIIGFFKRGEALDDQAERAGMAMFGRLFQRDF